MQVPTRRSDKKPRVKADAIMTIDKFETLKAELDKLLTVKRPREAADVQRLALMGDFSENAGYQLAKSRLRGINSRILAIEDLLKRAEIIEKSADNSIARIGHLITVAVNGKEKIYQILGSAESDPSSGVISYSSPLGSALLGQPAGAIVKIGEAGVEYKIVKIE